MGNIGSHTGHITPKPEPEQKWANSYPRNPPPPSHHKVLPDRDALQKLRATTNGEILHSGGTLSGRLPNKSDNPISFIPRPHLPPKNMHRRHQREQMKRFGSEPDLRQSPEENRSRRKKYKAPEPPPVPEWEKSRKVRLYKTRAEMKAQVKQSSPEKEQKVDRTNRFSLPEMRRAQSMPEFQRELKEVTERLKQKEDEPDAKLKTLDPIFTKKEVVRQKIQQEQKKQPQKTFYFGMNDTRDILEQFRRSSGSDFSSEMDVEECSPNADGIALQLRPILPKKQLEIPRFSPAAAWRLLSSVDSNNGGSEGSEEGSVFVENKIEKYSRPPPPALQIGRRSNHDKSGDSGISGDAPPIFEDLPEPNERTSKSHELNVRNRGLSWTPQQDLGDDSSVENGINLEHNTKRDPSKPHVFSFSLPRDNHLSSYLVERNPKQPQVIPPQEPGDNWFLSKSAPNSLNNGFNSLEHGRTDDSLLAAANKHNLGRVMYLPEFHEERKMNVIKSVENLCQDNRSSSEPEEMQDPPHNDAMLWKHNKPKKFTFQSTVRQIERRKLAEKLSKEAEKKEKQRLRELEAMQRVEEEFQKKRAREKASIRQQLRMFSLDETRWSSMPPMTRPEPDGAVSSSTPSPSLPPEEPRKFFTEPSATQVLSEYRQPQREYKEYRAAKRNHQHRHEEPRQTTIHPKVTCNMPKANATAPSHGTQQNGNYRKGFAMGVRGSRSGESSYSEDSRGHSPRMYRSIHAPITRF